MTIWDLYCTMHNSSDWCWILSKIANKYPCLVPFVESQFNTNLLYGNNIFVTNWALFDQICSLWFDLLRDFERAKPPRNNAYQGRDISFLRRECLTPGYGIERVLAHGSSKSQYFSLNLIKNERLSDALLAQILTAQRNAVELNAMPLGGSFHRGWSGNRLDSNPTFRRGLSGF